MNKDGKQFYIFASQDNGKFIRLDLEKLLKHGLILKVYRFNNNSDDTKVMNSIDVESAPEQSHS